MVNEQEGTKHSPAERWAKVCNPRLGFRLVSARYALGVNPEHRFPTTKLDTNIFLQEHEMKEPTDLIGHWALHRQAACVGAVPAFRVLSLLTRSVPVTSHCSLTGDCSPASGFRCDHAAQIGQKNVRCSLGSFELCASIARTFTGCPAGADLGKTNPPFDPAVRVSRPPRFRLSDLQMSDDSSVRTRYQGRARLSIPF
jgi:hypothetical protein